MNGAKSILPNTSVILKLGENSIIHIGRTNNGGASISIKPEAAAYIELARENAIGVALKLLEAVGVSVDEAMKREQAGKANVNKPAA